MHFEELLLQMQSSIETRYTNKILLISIAKLVEANIKP